MVEKGSAVGKEREKQGRKGQRKKGSVQGFIFYPSS